MRTVTPKKALALRILDESGGSVSGHTRFQKLAFLSQKAVDGTGPFDFIAYDYGPYDNDLRKTLEELDREGYINAYEVPLGDGKTRFEYELNPMGEECLTDTQQTISTELREKMSDIVDSYGDMPLIDLINEVYDRYPKYAKNSVF